MARTTLNIDTPILEELKRLQKSEGKTLGELVSELVAEALPRRAASKPPAEFVWHASEGDLRVDLRDGELLVAILDREKFDE